ATVFLNILLLLYHIYLTVYAAFSGPSLEISVAINPSMGA
ncbi:MAG: hypothetical protein ACI9S6_002776, partial [Reinekea sp.]